MAIFHYFAPVNFIEYEKFTGLKLLVGAASRKVIAVCEAINLTGNLCLITTGAVAGRGAENGRGRYLPSASFIRNNIKIHFLPTFGFPGVGRILTSFGYLKTVLFTVEHSDKVLLYNFYPEYIPSAFALNILGNPAYLDIEDAPRSDEKSLRGMVNRLSYAILKLLCKEECVVAAKGIADQLKLQRALPIYGTIAEKEVDYSARNFSLNEVRIMYGGTLCTDTGLDLFINTIYLLNKKLIKSTKKIRFIITGFGGDAELADLKKSLSNESIILDIKNDLSAGDYRHELEKSQAALCLKLPNSEMGETTFPSKVVEIASAGLLLFSTKVSDVPLLFDENSAVLLEKISSEELCNVLLKFIANPVEYESIAKNGHNAMVKILSANMVGKQLSQFLDLKI